MNLLIVGKNSFISNSIQGNVTRISFQDIDNYNLKDYDVVLNCSISPQYKNDKYDEKFDLDFRVAQLAQKNKCHFIMLSSRRVYGKNNVLRIYDEMSPVNPNDNYGENKLLSEEKIKSIIKECCILRCPNIYGLEIARKSFLGFCIDQLIQNKKIIYHLNGKIKRDFLPVEILSDIVTIVASRKLIGLYNASSNFDLEIEKIALSLIEGYGTGSYECINEKIEDQFVLSNQKLKNQLGIDINVDFENHIKDIGKRLCKI